MKTLDLGMAVVTLALAIAVYCVATTRAPADEQRRFWDARGNSVGTATTDSQGTTTYRDARGNLIGKSTTGETHGDRRQKSR